VLRNSPVASRPPSIYTMVRRDRYYDVWQRPEPAPAILEHLPLGDALHPTARPSCSRVLELARVAGEGGRLAAAVRRSSPVVADLTAASHPPAWQVSGEAPGSLYPTTNGDVVANVGVPRAGPYDIWVGGSFRRRLDVLVDSKQVSSQRNKLSHSGEYMPIGSVELAAGAHRVTLRYGDADLHPGSGEPAFYLGPLVLTSPPRETIRYVDPSDAASLCGRALDWVEALGP
jgi:hypothetical protein